MVPSRTDPIAIFDSGFGGLSVYRQLRETLPSETLLYFADTAHLPYGTKSAEELASCVRAAIGRLMQLKVKMVVVACHTAWTGADQVWRQECPVPLVEIASALVASMEEAPPKRALLLATEATVRSGYYSKLLPEVFDRLEYLQQISCPQLVTLVEEGRTDNESALPVIEQLLKEQKDCSFDSLLLACTHFSFLAEPLQAYLGLPAIDPAAHCAKMVQRVLEEKDLFARKSAGNERFLVSGDPILFTRFISHYLDNQRCGTLFPLVIRDNISHRESSLCHNRLSKQRDNVLTSQTENS